MKFYLGLSVGLILGAIVATAALSPAQLAPFTAPLDEQLNGIRAEQYLSLERELERAEHDRSAYRAPCP
jgi:hypothetical protein